MWLVWVAVAISILVICFVPKRLPRHENFLIITFTASFAMVFDLIVGNIIDLYDYGDPRVEYSDLAQIMIVNPAIGLLLLNYWPENKGKLHLLLYLLVAVGILLLFEVIWLKLGIMIYKGWSLGKSAFSYPFLFLILRLGQRAYRNMVRAASAAK
jgi:hypothetical protein